MDFGSLENISQRLTHAECHCDVRQSMWCLQISERTHSHLGGRSFCAWTARDAVVIYLWSGACYVTRGVADPVVELWTIFSLLPKGATPRCLPREQCVVDRYKRCKVGVIVHALPHCNRIATVERFKKERSVDLRDFGTPFSEGAMDDIASLVASHGEPDGALCNSIPVVRDAATSVIVEPVYVNDAVVCVFVFYGGPADFECTIGQAKTLGEWCVYFQIA